MSDTIEVSRDVFESIIELVRLGLFKDEKEALKNLVLDQAASPQNGSISQNGRGSTKKERWA